MPWNLLMVPLACAGQPTAEARCMTRDLDTEPLPVVTLPADTAPRSLTRRGSLASILAVHPLTSIDRAHLGSSASWAGRAPVAPGLDLLASARRARSERGLTGEADRSARYSLTEAGAAVRLSGPGGVGLSLRSGLSRMKRRSNDIPVDLGARLSSSWRTGVGIDGGQGAFHLALDQVRVQAERTTALQRMEDVMGGAPMTGRGMELTVSGQSDFGATWSLRARTMRAGLRDSGVGALPPRARDQRATLTLSWAL